MATRIDLENWVLEAVEANGGEASVLEAAKSFWTNHQKDLAASGDLFFTWQYDMSWAAQRLRDTGRLSLVNRKWVRK